MALALSSESTCAPSPLFEKEIRPQNTCKRPSRRAAMRALASPLAVRLSLPRRTSARLRAFAPPHFKQARRVSTAPQAPPAVQHLRQRVVACSAPQGAPPDAPRDALLPPPLPHSSSSAEAQSKADLYKASGVTLGLLVAAGAISHEWVGQHEARCLFRSVAVASRSSLSQCRNLQALALSGVFVLGYAGIIFEEFFAFNKAGVALLTAVGMWTVRAAGAPSEAALNASLGECLADVSQIVFFLIGAMTVVETVDAHAGFKLVTDAIDTRDKKALLWLVGGLTFCMSAILDNLTSTIVMVSLLRKLVKDPEQRKTLGAVVVIAANAGGAWTPIGDVTTTMLWINGQISSLATMRDIFLPAAVSLIVPLALLSNDAALTGEPAAGATRELTPLRAGAQRISLDDADDDGFAGGSAMLESSDGASGESMAPRATLVFAAGVAALVFVPVFKTATGLPPYMGMLFGLGALWLLTDAIHYGEPDRAQLSSPSPSASSVP